ncbi:hypothetical protein R6Q59_036698 [Mikania micrantha]
MFDEVENHEMGLKVLTQESLDKLYQNLDQKMVIQTEEDKLKSYLDGHYDGLFNEMVNFKGVKEEKGKEKVYECVKIDSLTSMVEFLDSLENEMLVNNNKETFKVCFDNMLRWFYKKQLRLEKELDMPPNLDGCDIEMMHFYLIVKYMGGYEKVTKEESCEKESIDENVPIPSMEADGADKFLKEKQKRNFPDYGDAGTDPVSAAAELKGKKAAGAEKEGTGNAEDDVAGTASKDDDLVIILDKDLE